MKKRLKHSKPPLPPFALCAVKDEHSDPNDFKFSFTRVLKIEEHQECTAWKWRRVGKDNRERICINYKRVKAHYRPGNSCYIKKGAGKDANRVKIPGCIGVMREIKVFEKGNVIGKPFRF